MKRKIALLLAMVMLVSSVPDSGFTINVLAAGEIGTITSDDGTWSYSSYESLTHALSEYYKNKTVTVDMKADWNAAESGDFNRRLFIPENSRVTLNMHGLVYNRNNAHAGDSYNTGELIYVEKGATLTINGGTKEEREGHSYGSIATYTSDSPSGKRADGRETFCGGLLTGGLSSGGSGGIHAKDNTTVILNDVIIAGCGQSNWGKGGGIWLKGSNSTLRLNNSRITGCWSSEYGGAIEANYEKTVIELNNSRIDHNHATNEGGGIYIDGEKIHITGRNGSVIDHNSAGDNGGGVYMNQDSTSVSGVEINDNSSGNGGGIYVNDTDVSMSDLVVKNNHSSKDGGGIYIWKNNNTISSCTVTENRAEGDGGGVYVYKNVNEGFSVTGKTIVKDNSAKGMGNQFHISDSDPEDTRVNFSLTMGANVCVSYANIGSGTNYVMVSQGKVGDTFKSPNCIQYLTPQNSGFHFTYNASPNQRKIYYVRDGKDSSNTGSAYEFPGDPIDVKAADANNASGKTSDGKTKAGVIRQVGPGGGDGSEYDLIRAFSHHQRTGSNIEDTDSVFFYSDAFFDQDPKEYNEHLATTSLAMAFSAMYLSVLEDKDASGNTYYYKHAGGRQFMADIGCPDNNIYINDSNEKVPGTDTIGVTIASKELAKSGGEKTGYILMPIAIRGGGYEREWASNVTLGKEAESTHDGEAQGFAEAADQVIEEIDKYISKYDLGNKIAEGKVKFWISGYSRAGATSNLTAKRLVEKYACGEEGRNNQVFAYTWEAPMGGYEKALKLQNKECYYCIHNMVNAADIVPLAAPQLMGFERYGVDHYIPGTQIREVKTEQKLVNRNGPDPGNYVTVLVNSDNDIRFVKTNVSSEEKNTMLKNLKAIDSSIVFDDYFHPMAMDLGTGVKIYENGDYGDNHVELFIRDFMRFAQEGKSPDSTSHWSQAIKNRHYYVDYLQRPIRDTLSLVFSMPPEDSAGFIGRASSFMDKLDKMSGTLSMMDIYKYIVGGTGWSIYTADLGWHKQSPSTRSTYINFIWQKIVETGALDFLDPSEQAKLQKNWPELADMIFTLAESDMAYNPGGSSYSDGWAKGANETMMLLATFVKYSSYILMNHYPEVNLAWARTYDSYYDNELTEYEIVNTGYSVSAPMAYVNGTGLTAGGGSVNKYSGDQKVILDVKDIVGEAIYYDLKDETNGKTIADNLLYRGGVDLSLGGADRNDYTISCYAISYGVKSPTATYSISLGNSVHAVKILDYDNNVVGQYQYGEGEKVTLAVQVPDERVFIGWDVSILDEKGDLVCMTGAELLTDDSETGDAGGANKNDGFSPFITITMPRVGDVIEDRQKEERYEIPEKYSIVAKGYSVFRISEVKAYVPENKHITPVVGEELLQYIPFSLTSGKGTDEYRSWMTRTDYRIAWSYMNVNDTETDKKTYPVPYVSTGDDGPDKLEIVQPDRIYIATVNIWRNPDIGISFMPTDKLSAFLNDAEAKNAQSIAIERNDGDESATIMITFKPTVSEETPAPSPEPSDEVKITVNAYDINFPNVSLKDTDLSSVPNTYVYHAKKGDTITILEPEFDDEMLSEWDFGGKLEFVGYPDSGTKKLISVRIPEDADNEINITAKYYPVIKSIQVKLDKPVTGRKLQTESDKDTVKITISNDYVISPDFVKIRWSPEPLITDNDSLIADQGISYTATLSIVPKKDGNGEDYIMAKGPKDTEYIPMSGNVAFVPHPDIRVNDSTAALDAENMSISYTFPMTDMMRYNLVSVTKPNDISDIAYGTDAAGILKLLPKTVRLLVDNGMELDAEVEWTLTEDSGDIRRSVVWTCTGNIVLPRNVDNNDNIPLGVTIFAVVKEADHALSPVASLDSGTLLFDSETMLTTMQDGGKTYYTLDGSEPTTESTLYNGESIMISRRDTKHLIDDVYIDEDGNEVFTGRKKLVLNAFTVCEGMWDSKTVTYQYIFDDTVPVMKGEEFIYSGSEYYLIGDSEFYTVDKNALPEGIRVTDDGSYVASEVGTYTFRLKIADGYKWKVDKESEDESIISYLTTEDQTVNWIIRQRSVLDARITVLGDPVMFDYVSGYVEPGIDVTIDGVRLSSDDYEVVYLNNDKPAATGYVKIYGVGSYTGESAEIPFTIYGDEASAFTHSKIPYSTYTGKRIIPQMDVYYAGKLLKEKKDYTIKYSNNVNANDKTSFTIKGKGNYAGTETDMFLILPKPIYDNDVSVSEIPSFVYNGKDRTPVPKIRYNKMTLKSGKDFTVKYYTTEGCTGDPVTPNAPGTYYARIEGTGNYSESLILAFDITAAGKTPVSKLNISKIADQPFTGEDIDVNTLNLVVKDKNRELKLGEDYFATCYAHDAGTGTVVITGNGEKGYAGSRKLTFNVVGISLKDVHIDGFSSSLEYDGAEKKQNLRLSGKMKGKTETVELVEGTDYSVEYTDNTDVGTATVVITGMNRCSGTLKKTFKITPYNINNNKITIDLIDKSCPYSVTGAKPFTVLLFGEDNTVLAEGKDYKLTYLNNKAVNDGAGNKKPAVKVTGIGNFTGTNSNTVFKITPADMEEAGVRVIPSDVVFKEKAGNYKTKLSLVDMDGNALKAGKDYNKKNILYSYDEEGKDPVPAKAIVLAGTTLYLTVSASGNSFTGKATGAFRVISPDRNINKLIAAVDPKLYTGNPVTLSETDIKLKLKKSPVEGVTFTIDENSYKKNVSKGTATVMIYGTGDWGGSKKVTFRIGSRSFLWWWRPFKS